MMICWQYYYYYGLSKNQTRFVMLMVVVVVAVWIYCTTIYHSKRLVKWILTYYYT